MTRIIRRRDHGRSLRHKRHLKEYATIMVDRGEGRTEPRTAEWPITLGDQDDTVFATHDDTHNARHRVLDALGALLVFLHLTQRHDNDATS